MTVTLLYIGTDDGLLIYRAAPDLSPPQRIGTALTGADIRAITAFDAATLAVAVEGESPQQSFDGGKTWSVTTRAPQPVGTLVQTLHGPAAPAHPRLSGATAYARLAIRPPILLGAGAGGMMLFRSGDDGIHWQPARLSGALQGCITALMPDPVLPRRAWAVSDGGTLLRTDDAGQSWQSAAQEAARMCCLAAADEE